MCKCSIFKRMWEEFGLEKVKTTNIIHIKEASIAFKPFNENEMKKVVKGV